jgi:GTP pyrophosphokinase
VKTVYSIWQKLRHSARSIHQLQDLVAVRVIVRETVECYRALERLRAAWMEIPGSLDDYIARPKPNGYQSLHLSLVSRTGHPFELQVRTRAMHEVCEMGSAAHWRYASERPRVFR